MTTSKNNFDAGHKSIVCKSHPPCGYTTGYNFLPFCQRAYFPFAQNTYEHCNFYLYIMESNPFSKTENKFKRFTYEQKSRLKICAFCFSSCFFSFFFNKISMATKYIVKSTIHFWRKYSKSTNVFECTTFTFPCNYYLILKMISNQFGN